MKEFYITNTETVVENDEPEIHLHGRTDAGKSDRIIVEDFPPYFYVRPSDVGKLDPMDHDNLAGYKPSDYRDVEHQEKVCRVVVNDPNNMEEVAGHFPETWEADVDYTARLRIDHDLKTGVRAPRERVTPDELEPVEMEAPPRVLTFDIETDDRGEGFPDMGGARILSIVAHDSYADEYTAFLDLDGKGMAERFPDADLSEAEHPSDIGLDHIDTLEFAGNERKMLKTFGQYVSNTDPDLVVGWNSNGFDTPFVIERMESVNASKNRLARGTGDSYTNWRNDPVIQGRTCYDLMDAWTDTKFTKVAGSLDEAASMELDDAKIPHPDKGFYELYTENTRKFLNYNAKDTHLTVGVNEAANVLGFKTALRNTIGLDYEQTTANNEYIEMMIRRKLDEAGFVGPTADPPEDAGSYDGAYVFDAFYGLKENIVGIDLASLYPNTLWMLNASPETKLGKIGRDFKEEWVAKIRSEGYNVSVSSNGVVFCLEEDGIFRELVDEALALKEYAGVMKEDQSLTTEERAEWAEEYSVRKTIVNSIYGVLGWVMFFLYDKDIASAVTLTGQEVIKTTADYVNNSTIAEVAYGDTDSNYIEFDSSKSQSECLNAAQEICDSLNNEVYVEIAERMGMDTDVDDHHLPTRFEIELEMYASRFFMSGQKKFYAYVKDWEEGMDFSAQLKDGKGKLSISGYPCVKANTAQLTKEVMREVLEAIVRGKSKSEIRSIVNDAVKRIDPADPDFDLIGIPGGLGKALGEYTWTDGTPKGASPRAAYYANLFVPDCNFGEGETVKRCYLKQTTLEKDDRAHRLDVIGYERGTQLDDLRDDLTIDVSRMQDTLVRSPMDEILDAIDVDVDAAIEGQSQSGLGAFC